jgi:hypothetical protein
MKKIIRPVIRKARNSLPETRITSTREAERHLTWLAGCGVDGVME